MLRVQGDFKLIIKQVNEEFVLKETALMSYQIDIHKLIKYFSNTQFEHVCKYTISMLMH